MKQKQYQFSKLTMYLLSLVLLLTIAITTGGAKGGCGGGADSGSGDGGGNSGGGGGTLSSIAVTPANPSITVGATQQFTATGTYSDSSTQNITASATWGSSDTAKATINASGLATAVAAGSTTITATSGSISGNTMLTVTSTSATVTDIDGNVYNTVTIGTQVWMKENLKVTKYRNGDAIGTTIPATLDISGETSPKYQWAYYGNESNVADYGRLYTWYAATDSRGLCPTGWHLPTDAEWTTLTTFLGGEAVAGGKMKEAGTSHWNFNTGADNSSGWTGLPGGYRHGYGAFFDIGNYGDWWSASELNATYAWARYLLWYDTYASRGSISKELRLYGALCQGLTI